MVQDDVPYKKLKLSGIYIGIPSAMVVLVYVLPWLSIIWVVICLIVLAALIVHLYISKPGNLLLVGAIVPNTLGPLISQVLLSNHNIPTTAESDILVSYAFHIAALFALVLFVILRVQQSFLIKVTMVFIVGLFVNIAASSPYEVWHAGPELFGGLFAPSVSPLFVGRVVLTLLSAYIALNHDT